jgi:hypothetical protein
MKNDYYESPKPGWLTKQFWRAAGADRYLLERSTYSDQIKYFCLGGIVTATGVMAALAGGYAFYTIFDPNKGSALENSIDVPTVFISLIFGVIWGLIIYNIDRFIVASTGKGDGTEAITKQEITGAIPRIIMGLIIALTISKPLEIRMFKSEIDQALFQKQEKIKEQDKKEAEDKYATDINKLKDQRLVLWEAIDEKEKRYWELEEVARQELDGTGGSGNANPGPIYQSKKADANNAKRIWESVKATNEAEILKLDEDIEEKEKQKEAEILNATAKANKLDGLLERIKLAHEVSGIWISLFITLLFVVIELTPIFFKMMLIKGPYDYMDENVKELSRAELGIEIEYNFYTDKEGLDKHKVTNHAAENKRREKLALLAAQDEMNRKIIEEWKKRELKKIEENPEDYISNG